MKHKMKLESGFAVQASNLQFWAKILTETAYHKVYLAVMSHNAELAPDALGTDVLRGTGITSIVTNLKV